METRDSRRGIAVDYCAGAGPFAFGLESAGLDAIVSVEHEAERAATHDANLPYGRTLVEDLATLDPNSVRRAVGEHEEIDVAAFQRPDGAPALPLVFGGPPCQGVSSMGRRDPDDPRNDLMGHYVRHAVALQPRYVVMENVKGLLDPRNRSILDTVVDTLERGGYTVVTPIQVLRAHDFGVPQSRERVFLLAYRQGEKAPDYPEPTHGTDDLFASPRPTVRDALAGLPDPTDFPDLWTQHWTRLDSAPAPTGPYAARMAGLSNDPDDYSYPRRWDRHLLTNSMLTRHTVETVESFMATPPNGTAMPSKRQRLAWDGLSRTLRAGTTSKRGTFTALVPIHPSGKRQITVREAARLHSIPDWYLLHPYSRAGGYLEIGNSVPPLMARALFAKIREAAGITPIKPSIVLDTPSPIHLNSNAA